jgi:Flp pilus assembly protein TadD
VHERLGWFLGSVEGVRLKVNRGASESPLDARREYALVWDRTVIPEALFHFREAVRWDPLNAYYHRSLGLFALNYGVNENGQEVASDAIAQALALRPDFLPEILGNLLARRVDDGFLLAAMPRKAEVLLDLGRMLEDREKRPAATIAFDEALKSAPTPVQEVEVRLEYARALIERKKLPAALEQARHALMIAPRDAEVFALLATIHAQMNQGAEAETALTTAVSLAESGPARRRNNLRGELAALLVQRGQSERAAAVLRQVLQEKPNDGWAHLELGRILERKGDAAAALQGYRAASATGGEDWSLHQAVGRVLRDAGYLREAVSSYETAVRLRPTDGELRTELGDLYARIGLRDRAVEQYREVLRRQPDHASARRGLVTVTAGAGS